MPFVTAAIHRVHLIPSSTHKYHITLDCNGKKSSFLSLTDNCNLRHLAVIVWRLSTISLCYIGSLPLFMTKRSAAPSSHFITRSNATAQWCMELFSLPDLPPAEMVQQTCKRDYSESVSHTHTPYCTFKFLSGAGLGWIYDTSLYRHIYIDFFMWQFKTVQYVSSWKGESIYYDIKSRSKGML